MPSMTIEPPFHPTYDLKTAIGLALAEDAGDRGLSSASPGYPTSNVSFRFRSSIFSDGYVPFAIVDFFILGVHIGEKNIEDYNFLSRFITETFI